MRPTDGPGFAWRVMELAAAYDSDIVAVQFNVIGSHDTPRLRSIFGGDLVNTRLATLLQATLPGAPCIYYGDEVGMTGGLDPDNRRGFPWDPARWELGLRDTFRALLHLRTAEAALRHGSLRFIAAAGPAAAFERRTAHDRLVIVANPGDAPTRLELEFGADGDEPLDAQLEPIDVPGLDPIGPVRVTSGRAFIDLPPWSGAILRAE